MNNFEPQPGTAFERLSQDAQSSNSPQKVFKEYGIVWFFTLCYGGIALLQGLSHFILFTGMFVVLASVQSVSERRAERRHKLLIDAVSELHRGKSSSDAG